MNDFDIHFFYRQNPAKKSCLSSGADPKSAVDAALLQGVTSQGRAGCSKARLGVVTLTLPVVAPAGTVVVMSEGETTVNVAAVPLKLTLVAPGIGSQNLHGCFPLAGRGLCFHKRAKADSQAKERATAINAGVAGPAIGGCPVESPVCGLDQRARGIPAVSPIEAVQRGQRAPRGDPKDCPAAPYPLCPLSLEVH